MVQMIPLFEEELNKMVFVLQTPWQDGIGVGVERSRGNLLREHESQSKRDPFFSWWWWRWLVVGWWLVVGGRVERSGATFHPKNYYSPLVSCVLRLI